MAEHALSTPFPSPAKPSRRRLLTAGAALAAAGTAPAVAGSHVAPDADAELIRLADLAVAACRGYCANLSDEVHVPAEVEAELDRWSALARDCYMRAAAIRAITEAGKRAKAQIVTLANSYALTCDSDPAVAVFKSFLDDMLGGEGSAAVFDRQVNYREGVA